MFKVTSEVNVSYSYVCRMVPIEDLQKRSELEQKLLKVKVS